MGTLGNSTWKLKTNSMEKKMIEATRVALSCDEAVEWEQSGYLLQKKLTPALWLKHIIIVIIIIINENENEMPD
ncbi:hypothetical protein POUND7_001029 [Theobroma cacao]